MYAKTALLALLPAASLVLAGWDDRLCDGVGGCQGLTWFAEFGYKCPSGVKIDAQPFAVAVGEFGKGNYEYVASDEFPASCERSEDIPGPAATTQLVKHADADSGLTLYGYITDSCTVTKVATPGDCYTANPNPSPFTMCRVTEKDIKTFCTQDPSLHL